MLHSTQSGKVYENPLSGRKVARVLVIYTGGTIGMKDNGTGGYTVVPNYFAQALKRLPMLYDEDFAESGMPELSNECEMNPDLPYCKYSKLVMPMSKMGVRVVYYIKELDPILDSSNMSMEHWTMIAKVVKENYDYFDSFVILHGTDTMAYTASALSYMFENLDKTVVLTGSQIPIFEQRNDGRSNFIGALVIAGHFIIPEVTLFFNNKLFRGNRSQKVSASDLDAFDSPNLPPLAKLGTDIEVAWDAVFPKTSMLPFHLHDKMSENVGLLQLFPGINAQIVRAFLSAPMEGIVIESFGSGNIPSNRPDLVKEFKEAAERGVLMLNITQCARGTVTDAYAAGRVLFEIGVIPGYDMTPEAALAKMAYVLSKKEITHSQRREYLEKNIRGEMTFPKTHKQFSMKDGELIQTVAKTLRLGSQQEMNSVRKTLLPVLLTCAAKAGDLNSIKDLVDQGANLNEPSDYDGKTSLHLAAAEGHVNVVQYLLLHGASYFVRDRRGRTPLFDAIRNKNSRIVDMLISSGANFDQDNMEVARELSIAATDNDVERLRLWLRCNVNMNISDLEGRSPLHVAVLKGNKEAVKFLVEEARVNVNRKDIFGRTPIENAVELQSKDVLQILLQVLQNKRSNGTMNKLNGVTGDVNMNNLINCKMNCGGN